MEFAIIVYCRHVGCIHSVQRAAILFQEANRRSGSSDRITPLVTGSLSALICRIPRWIRLTRSSKESWRGSSDLYRVPWTPSLGVLSESGVQHGDATAVQSGVQG